MSKWIKVEDGMPRSYVNVLVCNRMRDVSIAYYGLAEWELHKSWISDCGGSVSNVTHWRYLPPRPRRKA